jgi:hypothetical protein
MCGRKLCVWATDTNAGVIFRYSSVFFLFTVLYYTHLSVRHGGRHLEIIEHSQRSQNLGTTIHVTVPEVDWETRDALSIPVVILEKRVESFLEAWKKVSYWSSFILGRSFVSVRDTGYCCWSFLGPIIRPLCCHYSGYRKSARISRMFV